MDSTTIYRVDALIVGSGAAGLTAAAVAQSLGLNVMLVERTDKIGGTTSYSGGTIWIPNNSISMRYKVRDTRTSSRTYMDHSLLQHGTKRPESSDARIDAFLDNGPDMVDFLIKQGFKWSPKPSPFPDYHPETEGALRSGGRTLDPAVFDAATLGSWSNNIRRPLHSAPAKYFHDFRILTKPCASILDGLKIWWMGFCAKLLTATMGSPVYMGCSLVAQLLALCLRDKPRKPSIHLNAPLKNLIIKDGRVQGGIIQLANDQVATVHARYGVILAAAGFARSQDLRNQHLPRTQTDWTLTQPDGDLGDALRVGEEAGAATALLDEAWWIPTMADPSSGQTVPAMFEVSKPHCIIVNKQGLRFLSEADPYGDAGRSLYKHLAAGCGPAWLILDSNYRKRYTLGSLGPGAEPADNGHIFKADTISGLADRIGVDGAGLTKSIKEWNETCDTGTDERFGKGQGEYQAFVGDSSARHPNIGPVALAPFYAIAVQAGDAGTKGGLLTDEFSRVVRPDGSFIPGLYAAGNSAASVMGPTSLGAGVTIGPAMTFAYIAVQDMCRRRNEACT